MEDNSMTGLSLNGKKVGALSINGKSLWSKMLSVSYFEADGSLLSTVNVKFMSDAPELSASEIDKKQFVGWDKKLTKISSDLSTNPVYIDYFDVTYMYQSNNEVISIQRYLSGSNINYINVPSKKNYTISNFIPESSFDVSPLSSDISVYVNDVKNEIRYNLCSAYDNDGEEHMLQFYNVYSFPGNSNISIQYYTDDWSEWKNNSPTRSSQGKTEVSVKFICDNAFDSLLCVDLSIGEAPVLSVIYWTRNYDETSMQSTCHYVDEGHKDIPPVMSGDNGLTLSSQFLHWSSNDYMKVKKDLSLTAIYKPRLFNVSYFDISAKCVNTQSLTYGSSSIQPTALVIFPGYKHLNWTDKNGITIPNSNFDFISSDISAYSFQKKICYVNSYLCYADKCSKISSYEFLSGDVFKLDEFVHEFQYDAYELDPYYKFLSCISDKPIDIISALDNRISLLYATNYYDYDMFRSSYVLKYVKDNASFAFSFKQSKSRLAIANNEDDLNQTYAASFALKYCKSDDISSANINFKLNDQFGKTIVAEKYDGNKYEYSSFKFLDRTSYIFKVKHDIKTISCNFQLNNNRAFTQLIDNNDILTFIKDNTASQNDFYVVFNDDICQFEYSIANDKWNYYKSGEHLNANNIKFRAVCVNTDLNQCVIHAIGYKYDSNSLKYLTTKYGECIFPISYYEGNIIRKTTDNTMLLSQNDDKFEKHNETN